MKVVPHCAYRFAVSTLEHVCPNGHRSYESMTRPLPLQLAYPLSYVGDLGSSTDLVVAISIPKRDSQHSSLHSVLRDFKFVDQVDCQCPRLGSISQFGKAMYENP
ncbi:jg26421 [Pararge aegeria aegeria]|uniref:Jg26421 protein n=1 Tax=Pararge aegeria aegeria TaxID=348720 RepID=A0A8S4RSB8_9NEOP|nr:jg26421 [Pararge aegeria aegeria]